MADFEHTQEAKDHMKSAKCGTSLVEHADGTGSVIVCKDYPDCPKGESELLGSAKSIEWFTEHHEKSRQRKLDKEYGRVTLD